MRSVKRKSFAKKNKLHRNKIKEEREFIKEQIKIAYKQHKRYIDGIIINYYENISYLTKLNYSVDVKIPRPHIVGYNPYYICTISWGEQEGKNGNKIV